MNISIHESYEKMSFAAAQFFLSRLPQEGTCLICPASGHTPVELYRVLVNELSRNPARIAQLRFIGLDEWVGLNGASEGSCLQSLNTQLLGPLKLAASQVSFFDGKNPDLSFECKKAEEFIARYQPINMSILGIGMNGHIGFNEPGASVDQRVYVTDLSELTIEVGRKYFNGTTPPGRGITLGIATLMDSKTIILLASGKAKAQIVHDIVEGIKTKDVPATLLKDHQDVILFLDKDAACMLKR